jgi:EAL domain-containing protein (putative c-di-GMP-specific phosphodiesterase class I)
MTISLPIHLSDPVQAYQWIIEGIIPTTVALQPIVHLEDLRIMGYEALARWSNFSPDSIFSVPRDNQGVERLEALLIQAISRIRSAIPGALFVNVHPSLSNPEIWSVFCHRNVVLEITEVQAINLEGVFRLQDMGFSLALDDLGTGHATFDALLQLRPEFLKLDKVLTQSVHIKARNSLLQAMVAHAHRLGSKVIAEGIETKEQLLAVKESGCHFGQGYLLGKPQLISRNEGSITNGIDRLII